MSGATIRPSAAAGGRTQRLADTHAGGTVPKRDLVGVLQVLLEMDRLRFARDLPGLEILTAELENFRAKITTAGHDRYEAWREGAHDDTVLATALACWFGERGLPSIGLPRLQCNAYAVGQPDRTDEIIQAMFTSEW